MFTLFFFHVTGDLILTTSAGEIFLLYICYVFRTVLVMNIINVGVDLIYWWQPLTNHQKQWMTVTRERYKIEIEQISSMHDLELSFIFVEGITSIKQNLINVESQKRSAIGQQSESLFYMMGAMFISFQQNFYLNRLTFQFFQRNEQIERFRLLRIEILQFHNLSSRIISHQQLVRQNDFSLRHVTEEEILQRSHTEKVFINLLRQKLIFATKTIRRKIKSTSAEEAVIKKESEQRLKVESEHWSKIKWIIRKMKGEIIHIEATERGRLEQSALRDIIRKQNCLAASREALQQQLRLRKRKLLQKSNSVPTEVIQLILEFLTLVDRCHLKQTCDAMRRMVYSHEEVCCQMITSCVNNIGRPHQMLRKYIRSVKVIQSWWKTTTAAIFVLERLCGETNNSTRGILSRRRQNRISVLNFDNISKARTVLFPLSSFQRGSSPSVIILTSFLSSECWICELPDPNSHISRCTHCGKTFHETCGVSRNYCLGRCAAAVEAASVTKSLLRIKLS